ncbi:MAG: 2-phospho-L-lactate transferase [Austwickia sp.]|nr:MAG: 2-phospho-L-lactate transferase [Austwickia sp.]
MRITALAGGVGGARFLRGLRDHLDATGHTDAELTIIGNTGDDITLFGLRVCPDLDTLAYTLADAVHEEQGWGRADERFTLAAEFAAYGAQPDWFTLGDRDLALHVLRSQWLGHGMTLSAATARVADRFGLPDRGVRLLPMSDQPVETHVVIDRGEGPAAVHFQEWWVRHRAAVAAQRFVAVGMEHATAAPGVLDAIRTADVVLLPPSNPVVSIGIVLLVPGVRDALRGTAAPVVGVSPIVGGAPVRGHADACLAPLGVPVSSAGVASLYADFLDGWLIDAGESGAEDAVAAGGRYVVRRTDLLMPDRAAAARLAGDTLDLALSLREG